jgi:hypothetical protein
MSKIKSPREKKALSLERDRRNTYGENPAASRKGIRRGKQRSHMEERRTVGKILSQLKDLAEEEAATESDVLAKTAIVKSSRKAFKKTPDSPLGEVIKQKLARRAKVLQTKAANSGRAYVIDPKELFDTPYDPALHKRSIMFQLRLRTGPPRWGPHKKKSKRIGTYDRQVATKWRDAILRDAPLLKGFFAEQPEWRDRMLAWCEKALTS